MIDSIHLATRHSIRRICAVLELPRSSYYNAQIETDRQKQDKILGDHIEGIFRHHKRRYGYRRILDDLNDKEMSCSPERVRRLMKQRKLHAIQPKTYVPRTSDGRADAPSANIIASEGLPNEPNRLLAGDITHIPTAKGWLYLAVVIDLYTRKIVGWKLADNMRSELVAEALQNACIQQSLKPGTIFHSDRGSQYGSRCFRSLLRDKKIRQSMSGRANPYDNAWTESVIGTIKAEVLQGGKFADYDDAKTELFEYIESYYNHHRKHSSLGYQSPSDYENNYYKN